jgi:ABC-type Fe3+ transport system substrate-binding protein
MRRPPPLSLVVLLATVLVSAAVVGGCQPPHAPATSPPAPVPASAPEGGHSPEVQRLLAAAAAAGEDELNLSWSQSSLGGPEGIRRYTALFNRMYGTNIRVNVIPGPSMTDMAGRIVQEAAAGRKASSDIFLGSEGHYLALLDHHVLEEYDYSLLSARIPRQIVAHRNVGVEIYNLVPGIAYNTDLVAPAEVPKRLEDVLDPKWKGKIATTQNAAYLHDVVFRPEWGPERMKAYVARLSEQVSGLVRSTEIERVISGEFHMLVLTISHQPRVQQAKGAPIGHVIPEDAVVVKFLNMGVPRNSAHPNLAKLFINMLMSEEGQQTLYEVYLVDHYLLPGSRTAAELEALRAKGVEPLKIDLKFATEHSEMEQLTGEIEQILREQRMR